MAVPPGSRRHRPPSPAQTSRNPGRVRLAGGLVLAAVVASVTAAERIAVQTAGGREVIGRVVREALDGSLLLEHDDGRYELLGSGDVLDRRPAAAEIAETAANFGRRVLAELPAGFDLLTTRHYVVCFDTTRDYARWCAALFERLHDAFGTFWSRAGLDLADPGRPLVVVIYADRRGYEAAATADLGPAADRVAGYYNLLTNRVATYDLTGSDAAAAGRGRQPGQVGLEILANPAAAGLVATLVHEATHQLAFNAGMHRRLAPVPLWVSEGIATYFEAPDLENTRGWRAVGKLNRPRLEHFLASYRPGCVETMVRSDEAFRDPDRAVDSYATAWAVCHHLLQVRKAAFVDYLRGLAAKQPLDEDSPQTRLREFQAAFGPPEEVERDVFKAMARLASRAR